jgi:hypothetical protein
MRSSLPPRIVAVVGALLASASITASAQSTVTVAVGSAPTAQVAPGGKLAVPVVIDLSAANGGNLASLAASLNWAAGRLTLDSLVKTGSFGTFTSNTADAANGNAGLTVFNATGTTTTTTFATAYFTALTTLGGTRIGITGQTAGTDAGASLAAALRTRPLDVCVVPFGKWGDVNGDSTVNILDAQQISRLAVALPVANANLMNNSGDVNSDGAVNIIDAQQIARAAIGLATTTRTGSPVGIVPAIKTVALTPGAQTLNVGQSLLLSPTVRDSVGTPLAGCVGLTWSSSDPGKATVDSNGVVTALASGAVNITVTAAGQSGTTALTVGTAATQGIRVTATSPVPVKGFMVWAALIDADSSAFFTSLATNARTATIDLPTYVGTNFGIRVAAIDSISGDTLRPIVAATGSAQGINVTTGALASVKVSLTVPSITIGSTSATTIAAGVPAPISWTVNDPSHLFTDQTTTAYCGRVRYRMNAPWTADQMTPDTISTLNIGIADCTTNTNLTDYTATLPVPTSSGRMYWQVMQQAFVPNSTIRPMLVGPRLSAGDTLRSVTVSGIVQGIKMNFTTPKAGTRFVVQIQGGGLPFSIYKKFDTTSTATGSITVPTPVGTGFTVRLMAIDARDPKGSRVISGSFTSGVNVTAGSITSVSTTLTNLVYDHSASPASATVGDRVNMKFTVTDPTRTFGNFSHSFRYSSTPFTADSGQTTVTSSSSSIGNNQWSHSATIPAQLAAGGLYYQVTEGFTALGGDELIPLRVVDPFLAAGDTARRIPVNGVTQGVRITVNSPVPALRWIIMADSGTLVTNGLPAQTSFIRAGNNATSATLDIPLPAGSNYRIRVLVVDTASKFPDSQPILAAGVKLAGITVASGAITTVTATPVAYSATWTVPTTGSIGTTLPTTFTLVDAGEFFDQRFFSGSTTTSCNVTTFAYTAPIKIDRSGSSVSACSGGSWSGNTLTATLTLPATVDTGSVYLQASAQGFFPLIGPDAVLYGVTPVVTFGSVQGGPAAPVVRYTTVPQALRVTVNSSVAAKKFVALVDGNGLASPLAKVVTLDQSTNSTTFDIPVTVGTGYRLRVGVIDPKDPAGTRMIAGGMVDGLAVTSLNVTGLTMPATAVSIVDSTATSQLVGEQVRIVWLLTDPSDILSSTSVCGATYYSTSALTRDYSGSVVGCASNPTNPSLHVLRTVGQPVSQVPTTPATLYYQTDQQACFSAGQAGTACLRFSSPLLSVGESQKSLALVNPTQGITVNVATPRGANQYYVLVDSGGLAAPINFSRAFSTYSRSASFSLALPVGSGYRVRVMVQDSVLASGSTSPLIASGIRLSNVNVTSNALTSLTATTQALVGTLSVPASVALAQPIPITVTLTDPSEYFYQTTNCTNGYVGTTPWTTDAGGSFVNLCKSITHSSNTNTTVIDTLSGPVSTSTIYLQATVNASSFVVAGTTYSPRYYVPALIRKESLQAVTVTALTSSIAVSITSPAARRYVVQVDSGGLSKPVVAILDGTAMTSGTVTVPIPAGSGYRVRVAAVDSMPGFALTSMGLLATGVSSGVSVSAGTSTAVSITTSAVTAVSTAPLTAVNSAPTVTVTVTDPGQWFSTPNGCAQLRTGSTAFTTVASISSCTSGLSRASATTWQTSSTLASQTSVGTIYTAWSMSNGVRAPLTDYVFYAFAPAFYRGAAKDSIRIVTPTQIAVNAGNGTSAAVGTAVTTQPSVIVRDANNVAVAGVTVTFAVASGGGSITGASAVTNASGIATVGSWTLGTTAGTNTVTATVSGLTGSPVTFTATGTAGAATQLIINAGNSQSAVAGAAVATAPSVLVKDANNNPVSGATVNFVIGSGGGTLSGGTQTTNASGIATLTSWTLGVTAGTNTLTANVTGLTSVTFSATGTAGTATKLVLKTAPAGGAVGAAFTTQPVVAVTDANGNTVTTNNTATIVISTSAGFTTGGNTAIAVNGLATFSGFGISGTTPLSPTLTFASGLLTSTTTSVSVSPGAAKSLGFNTTPAGAASGSAFTTQPVISIRDSLGNVRTQDNSTVVTMSVSGNGAGVGTVSATAVAGVATFSNVGILGTAGTTYTLTFSAGTLTNTTTIVPTAGTATQLVLTGSALGASAGTAFTTQPVVAIRDSFGNTLTSDISSVLTMTVNSGATVLGTATAVAVNGVVTWSNVGLSGTAGSYTLTFSKAGLTSATQSVTLGAGAATQIAVNAGNGQSATVNTTVANPPSVIVKDASNNPVSGVAVAFLPSGLSSQINGTGGQVNLTTNSSGIAALSTWQLGTSTGTYTVNATATGLSGSPIAFTATGTAGAAKTLVLTTSGDGAASGAAFTTQPVITVKDSLGNVRTQDNGTVITVSLSGGSATLSGTLTATTVNGVATFSNVAINGTSGTTYTLLYTASGLTTASQGITPTVGAATQLAISTPAAGPVSGGGPFSTQPVILLKDSGNNVVTTGSGTVTMSINSPATTFGSTSATLTSGLAAFSGAGLSASSGTYTITYSKSGLTSATQSIVVP